jgi:hypothetical protein
MENRLERGQSILKGNLGIKNEKPNLGHILKEGQWMKLAWLEQRNQQN